MEVRSRRSKNCLLCSFTGMRGSKAAGLLTEAAMKGSLIEILNFFFCKSFYFYLIFDFCL